MNKISLIKKLMLLFSVVFFASCDKEFNTIGSEIVGDDYFNFTKAEFPVTALNYATGPVQTNNLTLNSLGVYYNSAFGTTKAHFVTQLKLPSNDIVVNTNPVVDSVWVFVPFFSTQTGTDSNGIRQFELDSIYDHQDDMTPGVDNPTKFKLKVYENKYYLGDYNPDNENGVQRFYSNDKALVENNLGGSDALGNPVSGGPYLNNSTDLAENEEFFFNKEERIIYKTNGLGQFVNASGEVLDDQDDVSLRVVKERFVPGIWLNLNKKFFENRILKAGNQNLVNDNVFRSYFRGLYFQSEANADGQGALASLDFSKGQLRIVYKMDAAVDDDNNPSTPTATRLKRTLKFGLTGNTVNFFDTDYTLPSDLLNQKLYLKGGNGSAAYIDIFDVNRDVNNNQVPDELDELRAKNWLINEANLTFFIDQDALYVPGHEDAVREPNRIYIYDYKNKKPIVDFNADGSVNSSKPKYNKRGFSGIIQKETVTGKGIKYKVRITEYLKSCIKNDSTNFRLGLVVTENINATTNAYIRPSGGQQPSQIVPLASVLSPLGTVLHSPNSADPEKRLKLEIYYTEPE